MLVAELHQVLMDHEITCHRTCFSLQLGGTMLDSLTELRSIQGIQDGALIKVVEGNSLIFFLYYYYFCDNKIRTKSTLQCNLSLQLTSVQVWNPHYKGRQPEL